MNEVSKDQEKSSSDIRSKEVKKAFFSSAQQELFYEEVFEIKPVTKVTRGGQQRRFWILLLVGNKKNKFGFAHQKDFQIKNAILKARNLAKKNVFELKKQMDTIPYTLEAEFNAVNFDLLPASKNSGIRAGNLLYTALDFFGFKDVTVKSLKKNRSLVNRLEALVLALSPFLKKNFSEEKKEELSSDEESSFVGTENQAQKQNSSEVVDSEDQKKIKQDQEEGLEK